MKSIQQNPVRRLQAFTLIELMVVIAIIAILAALMIPLATGALSKQRINRARTEMATLETAIESYKAVRGHFPPDNPNNAGLPQLFYELTGTYFTQDSPPRTFVRLNGGETITESGVQSFFGTQGFVNTAQAANTNSETLKQLEARNFFPSLKGSQYLGTSSNGVTAYFIGLPVEGVDQITSPDGKRMTPWHYNSSNPTHNTESFDLWMDIVVKGRTNRICNWSQTPIVL